MPLNKRLNALIFNLSYIAIALTSGLRFETGTDYFSYAGIYNNIYPLNIAISQGELFGIENLIEPSYLFICSLFSMLGADVNIMFLAISLVTTALLFNSFKKYMSKYMYFGILLYYSYIFFLLDMSGVRQAISVNIFIFSIRYIIGRNIFLYLLMIILAASFHYTSIILIFIYPLYNRKFSITTMMAVMVISFSILVFKLPWMAVSLDLLGGVINNELFSAKLLVYASSSSLTKYRTLSPVMLLYIPVYTVAVLCRDKLSKTTPYYNILLNIFMFFMVSVFSLYESEDISVRVSSYFMFGFCAILPLCLTLFKDGASRTIMEISIFILSLYSIRNMIFGEEVSSILFRPYQNYVLIEAGIQRSDAQRRSDIFISNFGD